MLNKPMRILLNSCKETSELIDKQTFTKLSLKEKSKLYFHKLACNTCNSYEKQSKLIEKVIANWFKGNSNSTEKLSSEKKAEIISKIK